MIRFCQKCGHHYSDTSSTGCQTILLGGGVCGCDCLPLLMTCAPPPQRYTSGPGLASPYHEWLNLPPPLEPPPPPPPIMNGPTPPRHWNPGSPLSKSRRVSSESTKLGSPISRNS